LGPFWGGNDAENVAVLPDILCNGGGVIVSDFEWPQNTRSAFWDLEEVDRKLHRRLSAAYGKVCDTARERGIFP